MFSQGSNKRFQGAIYIEVHDEWGCGPECQSHEKEGPHIESKNFKACCLFWPAFERILEGTYKQINKIHSIEQLMPPFIATIHHHLVDRYMKRGYSNFMLGTFREVFI